MGQLIRILYLNNVVQHYSRYISVIMSLMLTVALYIIVCSKYGVCKRSKSRRNREQHSVRGDINIQTQIQPSIVEIPPEQIEMAPLTEEIPNALPLPLSFSDLDRVIKDIDLPPTYSECVMLSPNHYPSVDVNIPESPAPSYNSNE